MPHEWKSHLLITRCYKSAKNTASNVEDNDVSFLLISPDTSVWSRQRAFYPGISLSDVCTAKKLQDHFLSFFSASLFGFAPNSLKQFELCKKKTTLCHPINFTSSHVTLYIQLSFLDFRPLGTGIKVLRCSVSPSLLSPVPGEDFVAV